MSKYNNEMDIIDSYDSDDYVESPAVGLIIGSMLTGISFLTLDGLSKNLKNVFNTYHTWKSLEFTKAAAGLFVPITLFSGGLTGIGIGLYNHFKKKKQSTKKLTLTKE